MKQYLLTPLLIFSTLGNSVFAAPLDGALILEKGAISPYRGVLLTEAMAQQVYTDLKDYDNVKLINISLEKSIDFYKSNETDYLKEITELKDTNTSLQTTLTHVESTSTWSKVFYFFAGVLTTGLIVYAARQ